MIRIYIHPPVSRNGTKAGSTLATWSWLTKALKNWLLLSDSCHHKSPFFFWFRGWAAPSTRRWKCSGDSGFSVTKTMKPGGCFTNLAPTSWTFWLNPPSHHQAKMIQNVLLVWTTWSETLHLLHQNHGRSKSGLNLRFNNHIFFGEKEKLLQAPSGGLEGPSWFYLWLPENSPKVAVLCATGVDRAEQRAIQSRRCFRVRIFQSWRGFNDMGHK